MANIIVWLLSWVWYLFHEMCVIAANIIAFLFPLFWDTFQRTITIKLVVWVLPWLLRIFTVIFCYITYVFAYGFLVEYCSEIPNKRKKTLSTVIFHESYMAAGKNESTDAQHANSAENNDDELYSAPTPFDIKTPCHWYSSGNPFLAKIDTAHLVTAGEGSPLLLPTNPFFEECISNDFMFAAGDGCPPLLPTNPFLQDCITNPFIATCVYFPNIFDDPLVELLFYPTESELYCGEWIEQHQKYFKNSAREF